MQMWRANSSQVNPWIYPLRGVFTHTIGCNKPLELSHAMIIARGPFIPTTYFQPNHEQSPKCYNDIIAQSAGICTLISDGSNKELIKQKLQGPSHSWALWCGVAGGAEGSELPELQAFVVSLFFLLRKYEHPHQCLYLKQKWGIGLGFFPFS